MHSGSRRDNDPRHIRLAVDRRGQLTLDDDAHTSIVERDDRHSMDSSSPGLNHLGRRNRARAGADMVSGLLHAYQGVAGVIGSFLLRLSGRRRSQF